MDSSPSSRIDEWCTKILGSSSTRDRLENVTIRSLEVLNCALKQGFSSQNLQCALDTLDNDRNIAMKFDAQKNVALRQMIYSLADSIHATIQSITDANVAQSPEMIAPKEEEVSTVDVPLKEEILESCDPVVVKVVKPSFRPLPVPQFEQEAELRLFTTSTSHREVKSETPPEGVFEDSLAMNADNPMEGTSFFNCDFERLHSLQVKLKALKRKADDELEVTHRTVLVCPLCQHISSKATALQSHLRRIHDGVTMNELNIGLMCECGKMFHAFYALFKHNKNGCTGTLTMFNRGSGEINDGSTADESQEGNMSVEDSSNLEE